MDIIMGVISFILHIDQNLVLMVNQFGSWTYVLLFLIVFIETGVVIFPFLPGDSLLFAAGAMTALHGSKLSLPILMLVTVLGAILGDSLNYEIGKKIGHQLVKYPRLSKLINQEKLEKAEEFFNTHGGSTIFLGRFIPFIRTFIPFTAGASSMRYSHFAMFNAIGGICWVAVGTLAGFFFGNIPFVAARFSVVVLGIVAVSLIPVFITAIKSKRVPTN
jgi:membrane-associated protein